MSTSTQKMIFGNEHVIVGGCVNIGRVAKFDAREIVVHDLADCPKNEYTIPLTRVVEVRNGTIYTDIPYDTYREILSVRRIDFPG